MFLIKAFTMMVFTLFFITLPTWITDLSSPVKVIAISGLVYAVIKAAKQSPWFAPYLSGWLAVVVNVVFTIVGVVVTAQPDTLWTVGTLQAILIAVFMSSGIHGMASKVIMANNNNPPANNTPNPKSS